MAIYCVIFDGLQTTGHKGQRIFREQRRNYDLNSERMKAGGRPPDLNYFNRIPTNRQRISSHL